MKIRNIARRHARRAPSHFRAEWALKRFVELYPTATPTRDILAAIRELRASGFNVTTSIKINGRRVFP